MRIQLRAQTWWQPSGWWGQCRRLPREQSRSAWTGTDTRHNHSIKPMYHAPAQDIPIEHPGGQVPVATQSWQLELDIRLSQTPDIRLNMQLDLFKQRPETYCKNLLEMANMRLLIIEKKMVMCGVWSINCTEYYSQIFSYLWKHFIIQFSNKRHIRPSIRYFSIRKYLKYFANTTRFCNDPTFKNLFVR